MARSRRVGGVAGVGAVVGAALVALGPTSSQAVDPAPGHQVRSALGNGLGRLVAGEVSASRKRAAGSVRVDHEALTVRDDDGRVLVTATPRSGADRQAWRQQVTALGMEVTATDPQLGTLEGFVPVDAVAGLAGLEATGTVAQVVRPLSSAGSVDWAGVPFQKVDRVHRRGIDGSGITIGALSDSFDTALEIDGEPIATRAADDVASGDLPGPGNRRNPNRVVVVEDYVGSDSVDEGRGMLQIAHDVAPRSRLCFATAYTGPLGFADNIRRLADLQGPCRADVVVDDIVYLDEPFFSDSVISDAVDDVAAAGVHYFSSAGNQGTQNAWESAVRLVSPQRGIAGSDLDFSQVDPGLYDGGLQDMDPGAGVDVAQTITVGPEGTISFQWDDPFDLDGATFGDPIWAAKGEITAAEPEPAFTFTATRAQVGTTVEFRADAVPSGTTDLLLTVVAPDGRELGTVDTGTSPEVLPVELDQAGDYTVVVTGYAGEVGDFELEVRPVNAPSRVSTDFNVLFFLPDGTFLTALADLNRLSGRPVELETFEGPGEIQMVVTRSGTGPVGASRLRAVGFGDWYFTEYSDPLATAVFGHVTAKGATGVAAYEPFRPFLPEPFTSPGGRVPVLFDSDGNRYRQPQLRTTPLIASTDGGNTTFFTADTIRDPDDLPNFFGTSAAAPHAAAMAALVLDARGPMRPDEMRRLLSRSTFAHDLDPMRSGGSSGGLTVSASGSQGEESTPIPGPIDDTGFFRLQYDGRAPITSVTFFAETASPTSSDGMVFDPRPLDPAAYSDGGFPFTVGATGPGLQRRDVRASFSVPAGGAAPDGVYRRMTVHFDKGLKRGQWLTFGVDRDLAVSPFGDTSEGNGADELGGAVSIPSGKVEQRGMAFVARRSDGSTVVGSFRNRLGQGYSPVDGYGLVDAWKAVFDR